MYSQNIRPSSLFIKLSEFIELSYCSSIFKEEAYMTTTLLNCFYAKDTRREETIGSMKFILCNQTKVCNTSWSR